MTQNAVSIFRLLAHFSEASLKGEHRGSQYSFIFPSLGLLSISIFTFVVMFEYLFMVAWDFVAQLPQNARVGVSKEVLLSSSGVALNYSTALLVLTALQELGPTKVGSFLHSQTLEVLFKVFSDLQATPSSHTFGLATITYLCSFLINVIQVCTPPAPLYFFLFQFLSFFLLFFFSLSGFRDHNRLPHPTSPCLRFENSSRRSPPPFWGTSFRFSHASLTRSGKSILLQFL